MLDDTSGFTDELDTEVDHSDTLQVENRFSNIQAIYTSEKGYTRLFSATRYGKKYVLKCLKADYIYTPLYRQALTKEFEIGLTLDHPNICRTIGLEEIPQLGTAIIIEYIDGQTLKELIDKHQLNHELGTKIAHQLVDALDYIHSKQTIHRDLKPSNIMITHNGHNVKLIDFSLSDNDDFDVLKQAAGTSGYIAPELLYPGAKATIETDIYSLGMVLHDIASDVGDKTLMSIAKHCSQHRPAARPINSTQIFAVRTSSTAERIVVAILVGLIVLLSLTIGLTLHNRSQSTNIDTDTTEQTNNQIVDFTLIQTEK